MTTEIGSNKASFIQRVFLLIFPLAMLAFVIYSSQSHNTKHIAVFPRYMYYIGMSLLSISIFNTFLYLPTGISFDTITKQIEIRYTFRKALKINTADIISYSTTTVARKGGPLPGIIIYLHSNNKVLISDFSLKDIIPFEYFLKDEKITANGAERINMLGYYFQYLKRK